jgi:hypothetical protein
MKLRSIVLSLLLAPPAGWGISGAAQVPPVANGPAGPIAEARLGVVDSIESSQVENDSDSTGAAVIGGVQTRVARGPAPSACMVGRPVGAGLPSNRRSVAYKPAAAAERQAAYFIRVRLEDGSHQTVAQIGLDGLRLGDGVRIDRYRLTRCEPSPIEPVSGPDGGSRAP